MYVLKSFLPLYFFFVSPCEEFLKKEIAPMEFRGEVTKKYIKDTFWYIDIQDEVSGKTINFT